MRRRLREVEEVECDGCGENGDDFSGPGITLDPHDREGDIDLCFLCQLKLVIFIRDGGIYKLPKLTHLGDK